MSTGEMFLSIDNLHVSFGQIRAVRGISFNVRRGEMVTLLGPSGCGKTTTLRCIAGLEEPQSGTISLEGEILTQKPGGIQVAPEERSLAMVFQSYAIWPHMNVFENVAYGLKARKVEKSEIREKVSSTLKLVGLGGTENRPSTKLSGGQQQRVALARAIVLEPKILLLDEPLSNLDAKLRDATRIELRELQQRLNITAVYVTHDQTEAMALSDRLIVFRDGMIEQEGRPLEVYLHPKTAFVSDFMGLANLLRGRCTKKDKSILNIDTLIGNIQCSASESIQEGDQVIVCLRPERIQLSSSIDRNFQFEGKVVRRSHLGEIVDYSIRVNEQIIRARTISTHTISEDETVGLTIDELPVAVPFDEID